MILIKLGGSLIRNSRMIVKNLVEYTNSNSTSETIIIVPGGSIFADTIRRVNPGEESAHWMAVLAMEQYGYYLADGTGAELIDSLEIPEKGIYILLPYRILKEKDELPHTWNVTSDTIAAWVALQLGARFIKVTDVDGIYLNGTLQKGLRADEIIGIETCVDAEFPTFLMNHKINCEIINGNCPGRLINALKGNIFGTVVKG
jgi:aspartokinase-like uncharacterized kinase